MTDVIVVALISATATILVQLVPKLLDWHASRKSHFADLLGHWKCQWYVDEDNTSFLLVEDTVEVTKLSGWKLEATGHHPETDYELAGRISSANIITLLFEGKSKRHSITGALAMKVTPFGDKMEGYWYGQSQDDHLHGGPLIWTRS